MMALIDFLDYRLTVAAILYVTYSIRIFINNIITYISVV